ncbi:L2 protein [Mustela putorius papillomavirus 1]|uniref:Minor capsid protein L2 n=1 Tax=Mustela putorius papillomavirus 1 TaxID=2259540 RepID=T1YE43_9PAPI|nr:L2 protein [Mustela putorius papillomavirus 1]AGU62953.1 L2 protein [Mustela putorius papillomavirus 1]
MAPRAKRVKRDSASNLYKHCVAGGDCIPDVVNKYENKTPADKILQIGGSLVYLGGLGIGTGKGTGGSTGYRPLGGGSSDTVTVGSRPSVLRPNVPVEPVGPTDIVTIDSNITSETPSIIPLEEGPPPNVIEEEIIAEGGIAPGPSGAPTVSSGSDDSVAILEVGGGSSSSSAGRRVVSRSQYNNASFVAVTHSTPTPGEASLGDSIIISSDGGGTVVGGGSGDHFEEIPLDVFGPSEFEITEGPKTSTPRGPVTELVTRAKEFYNRRITQSKVTTPTFLRRPQDLVQFEFENPAFDPDTTLNFPPDGAEPVAAPNEDFRDITKLSRPRFTANPQGGLRVSRLGTRSTIRLRSGTRIGGQTHYYFDVSSISRAPDPPSIELQAIGETSGDSTIVLGSSESSFINGNNLEGTPSIPEEAVLIDEQNEDFSNSRLTFESTRGQMVSLDITSYLEETTNAPIVVDDLAESVFVTHAENAIDAGGSYPNTPLTPIDGPTIIVTKETGVTYDLHPSLFGKRKRKRRSL